MVYGTLLVIVLGVLYGYFTPGRQNKTELFKKAVLYGAVLAIVLGIIEYVTGYGIFSFGPGILGTIIGIVVMAVLFIVGAWIGDWLEGAPKRTT